MAKCPDCYSIKILSIPEAGDGKCAACYGTGHEGGLSGYIHDMTIGSQPCPECHGTKQCQTCGGTGEVKSYKIEDDDWVYEEEDDDQSSDEEDNDISQGNYSATNNGSYSGLNYSSAGSSYGNFFTGVFSGLWDLLKMPLLFILSYLGEYWAGARLLNQTPSEPFTWLHLIVGLVCLPLTVISIIFAVSVAFRIIGALLIGALIIGFIVTIIDGIIKASKSYQETQTPTVSIKYCAIAYSPATGGFGYAYGYSTNDQANNRALSECKAPDCRIVGAAKEGCLAVAKSTTGKIGLGKAKSKINAEKQALRECRKKGRDCQILCSVCASQ